MNTLLWILAVVFIPLVWGWLVQALLESLWPRADEGESSDQKPPGDASIPDFQI